MCDMIGSQSGWKDAGYLIGNANVQDLVRGLVFVDKPGGARDIRITPGVLGQNFVGRADVMRGEETQICGALSLGMAATGLVCQLGNHTKWVKLQDRRIARFATFMTGELFAMLKATRFLIR